MEARGFSSPSYCITADPLLVNLKEETPGVILSNVDLVTPVYSLVRTIKLEPEPEKTHEEVVSAELIIADINGLGSGFLDTDEIKTERGRIETGSGQGTVARGPACHSVTNNSAPYFVETAGVLNENCPSLSGVGARENEYSALKLSTFKNLAVRLEPCNDNAFFKVPESTLNVTEVKNRTAESTLNKKLGAVTHIKSESSLKYNPYVKLVDIFANSSGAGSPSKMIIENCDASILPSASEMIVGSCDLPLLPDENSLNPGRLEWSRKRKATNRSTNSKRVTSQFTDSIKKKGAAKQLEKVIKKRPNTRSGDRFKGNKQTSKVLRDGANIINQRANKKRVTRLNSQRKVVGPPIKSPSKSSNVPSSRDANPGHSIPSTCMDTAESFIKNVEKLPKIILSRCRQAEKRSLRKPVKKTGSKNIFSDANLISDTLVQIEEFGKAPENVADKYNAPSLYDEETLSASNDVSDQSDLTADAPVEAAEGSEALENITYDNSTSPNVIDEETLSASNEAPKLTRVNIEQLEESNTSLGTAVSNKAAKKMAVINSSLLPIKSQGISAVNINKRSSEFKQQLKKAKSSKVAANCDEANKNSAKKLTASSSSGKNTTLSCGGNPKPILLSIEQWKKLEERFISHHTLYDASWQKHTIFANEEVQIKTVKTFSSEGKPYKERLYFITGKGWACERCEQIFRKSCHLKDHKKWCHVDLITCSRCPRTYQTLGHFRAHLRFCQKPVYKCPECPRVFIFEYGYDKHYSVNHGQEYICGDCTSTRKFRSRERLKSHIYKCHTEYSRWLTCNACGKLLRSKSVAKHMRGHDRKKLVCIHCGSHFTAERSLQIHWKTHNDTGNPAALMCTYCGKFFELKTELVKHLKEHKSERSFICEHCGKGFFKVYHLDTHLLSHKEKQFICPKCNRGFTLKHQLAAHLQTIACGGDNAVTSSKEKKVVENDKKKPRSVPKHRFICANCDKGFPSKRQLIIHLSAVLCGENASSTVKEVQKVARKKEMLANLSPSPRNQFTCSNCHQIFIRKHLLVAHFSSGLCSGGTLTVPNKKDNLFETSKKENEGLRAKLKNQFECANCAISFGYKPQLIAHLNLGQCGSDVMSSGSKIMETNSEDKKKSMLKSEEHFSTVFEHFVHKRLLMNSVPCSKDSVSSLEKPIINDFLKKKTEKSKPVRKNQFRREKCGQRFIYKRQQTAHLSSSFCGSGATSTAESTKTVMKTIKKKQKLRSPPTNQLTCGKCGQSFVRKRQLAAHLSSAVCCGNVISSKKNLRNGVGMKKEEKKSKSAPGILFVCANCNEGFVHKRKLAAHLSVGSCMSNAPTVSKKTKEVNWPQKEEKEDCMLTKSQPHCDKVFVHESSADLCTSGINVSPSLKQMVEAAAINMNKEKELMPVLPEKLFVCGSCDNGFANKQRLNNHICPAACCSHASSSSIETKNMPTVVKTKKVESVSAPKRRSVHMRNVVHERLFPRSCQSTTRSQAKKTAEVQKTKKIESMSVPKRRSVHTRNVGHERSFTRSCRNTARSSVKEQTKEFEARKGEKKISRSMSAKKQFVSGNYDQRFTLKRELSSHMHTRAFYALKKSKGAKAVKTMKRAVT